MTQLALKRLKGKTVYIYLEQGMAPTPYIVTKESKLGWGMRQPVGIFPSWIPLADAWKYHIIEEPEYLASKPLNIGQIREMGGATWLWIECLTKFTHPYQKSAYFKKIIGQLGNEETLYCGYPGITFGFDYDDYGKTWLAYTTRPSVLEDCIRKQNCNTDGTAGSEG